MALREWCGNDCCECETSCGLDESIPCSPDCENLTRNGRIRVKKCIEDGCDAIKSVFNMEDTEEILKKYGDSTSYPFI